MIIGFTSSLIVCLFVCYFLVLKCLRVSVYVYLLLLQYMYGYTIYRCIYLRIGCRTATFICCHFIIHCRWDGVACTTKPLYSKFFEWCFSFCVLFDCAHSIMAQSLTLITINCILIDVYENFLEWAGISQRLNHHSAKWNARNHAYKFHQ